MIKPSGLIKTKLLLSDKIMRQSEILHLSRGQITAQILTDEDVATSVTMEIVAPLGSSIQLISLVRNLLEKITLLHFF